MKIAAEEASLLARRLFEAYGAPPSSALVVAEHLVDASRMGLHSHGLIRLPEYLDRIQAHGEGNNPPGGPIDPSAIPSVSKRRGAVALIDGQGGFGQVAGSVSASLAIEISRESGISAVSARNMGHIGRLGAYVEPIARSGLVGLAFCNAPRWGHWVAPYAGREGRFTTNPLAFAFPTLSDPVVADFATSSATEGGIRYLRNTGQQLPPGVLRTSQGAPTLDPNDLYSDPPGRIQPLGGDTGGHKGTALSVLVELMAGLLAGDSPLDESRVGNNLTVIALEPLTPIAGLGDILAEYVRGTPPIIEGTEVMMPGDRELKTLRDSGSTVQVDPESWTRIEAHALRVGITAQTGAPSSVDTR